MPELPEIEVLRRSLAPHLIGRHIEDVRVSNSDLRERIARKQLSRRCEGRRIEDLRRRAKYLLIDLESGDVLIFHLGMSGRLTIGGAFEEEDVHEHVSLGIGNLQRLRFRDPRRFGLVLVRKKARLDRDRHFAHLGVEPLDSSFDGESLRLAAAGRRAPVKSFLMDSRVVVGVGNIYACEALHRAGIHPRRLVSRISQIRWNRLAEALVAVLEEAIEKGGTTLNDFADGNGSPGYFQIDLSVYGREGRSCPRGDGVVRRMVQAGRSTYYCPSCQR